MSVCSQCRSKCGFFFRAKDRPEDSLTGAVLPLGRRCGTFGLRSAPTISALPPDFRISGRRRPTILASIRQVSGTSTSWITRDRPADSVGVASKTPSLPGFAFRHLLSRDRGARTCPQTRVVIKGLKSYHESAVSCLVFSLCHLKCRKLSASKPLSSGDQRPPTSRCASTPYHSA
jgi:hypothetical protein